MANGHPVTAAELRAALTATKDELAEGMRQGRAEVQNALTRQRDELVGTMRQIETNLLTEFHRYATGQQRRFHTLEVSSSDIIERLATIEQRLLALEARRPPSI